MRPKTASHMLESEATLSLIVAAAVRRSGVIDNDSALTAESHSGATIGDHPGRRSGVSLKVL